MSKNSRLVATIWCPYLAKPHTHKCKALEKRFLCKLFWFQPPEILQYWSGSVLERGNKMLFKYEFKKGITNVDYVWMSLELTSKFNIPVNTPTHTHTHTHTHRRSFHSFLFTPLIYYFLTCWNFLTLVTLRGGGRSAPPRGFSAVTFLMTFLLHNQPW